MDSHNNKSSAVSNYDEPILISSAIEATFASSYNQTTFASSYNQTTFASSNNQAVSVSSHDQQSVFQGEELADETEFARHFQTVKSLSGGASGITGIYKYLGDDPDILLLLDDKKELVVKSLHESPNQAATAAFSNEVTNINNVLKNHNLQTGNLFPKIASINMDGNQYILVERICLDPENTNSKSLNPYLMALGANAEFSGLSQQQQSAHLGFIFKSMLNAQNQLHDIGLLHLDSALRNFMMGKNNSVRVIDFGLTLPLDRESGKASKLPKEMIYPHYACNQASLSHKKPEYSLKTDAFALRMASIEAMASYLGMQEGEPMNLAIHLQGMHVRFLGKQPLFLRLHRKDKLDSPELLAKLKEISEQHFNQPIFIKHNGKVHLFANNNPANVNKAEDWKLTEVCKTNHPSVKEYAFSEDKIRLLTCAGVPKLDELRELTEGTTPLLISNTERNQFWVLRYSKSTKDWKIQEIKGGDLKAYINKKVQFPVEPYQPNADIEAHFLADSFALNKIDRGVRRSLGNLFSPALDPYKAYIPRVGYSYSLHEVLQKNHKTQNIRDTLALLSDADRLSRSFNNLKTYAEAYPDNMRRELVLHVLHQFELYLKVIPAMTSAEQFRQAETTLFNQCYQNMLALNHAEAPAGHHLASLGNQFTALSEEDKTTKVVSFLIIKAKELMKNPSLSDEDRKQVEDDLTSLTAIQKGDPKGKYPKGELKKDLHEAGYRILKLAHPQEVAKKEKNEKEIILEKKGPR